MNPIALMKHAEKIHTRAQIKADKAIELLALSILGKCREVTGYNAGSFTTTTPLSQETRDRLADFDRLKSTYIGMFGPYFSPVSISKSDARSLL